ncbi:TonB-dependent receptor [Pedobacter antarcticus]|uniref:TonB-dependent receptor n=1 Tax=Pedobacter antarcticus TaxID=34086 RepID=UPI000880EC8C|nr:TonB-dependent receptor [Pedobacter antarcticus]SDM32400.1 Carboxypeptidase regulatory-like domain-containing protein [Pedobacter antarcticus]
MKKSLLFKFVVILFAFIGSVLTGNAQVTTSSMTGYVKDSKGALPGASVRAVHVPTGTAYATTTNNDGRFTIANMRVGGPYSLVVSFIGYESMKYENLSLKLGASYPVNVVLSDGSQQLNDVQIVASRDKTINSSRNGAATNISRQQIDQLPAISRSITDLTKLTPQANTQGDGFSFAGRNSLFNSLTLDGAQMNNVFGLSSLPGGQTGAQPFSLDALDELQINLAPYDVKQSGFTGAGVNAITKSGTNKFSGSVYTYYKDQNLQGYKVGETTLPKVGNSFLNKQFGFRLGGPIIKDKLFFFVNGEITRRISPGTTIQANRGVAGSNISSVLASDLDAVRNAVINKTGYDPGNYEGYSNQQNADNLTARIDWNINDANRLTVRYNYLKSFRDVNPSGSNSNSGRGPSLTSMIYDGMRYAQYNNIKSVTAELNTRFNDKFANNLQLVYTGFRDYRKTQGNPFPVIDIENGAGANYISLGTEPFSGLNSLNQDIYTLNENFNIFAGNHTFTIGGSVGYQKFDNAFVQFFNGQFRYKSVSDFISAVNGDNTIMPTQYQLTYSADPNNPRPSARFSQAPVAVYAQDEWYIKPNFKLTYGVRLDMPIYTENLASNPLVTNSTFRDGERMDVGKLPNTQILFSPRVGFNWDVKGDATLQIRGGSGVFTGAVPAVWLTNQAGQNGLLTNSEFSTNPNNRPFNADPAAYIPSNPTAAPSFPINIAVKDFKVPQVWRSSLAVDYKLPGGIVATIDGLYTKSLNEVFHRDANLVNPTGQFSGTGDTRAFFPGGNTNRINSFITNAIVFDNTNKGYAWNVTAQLQKKFGRHLDVMAAYTRSDARDISSNPGSQANSAFTGNPVAGDPNTPVLAYSSFVVKNRVIASVNVNFSIIPKLPTSFGVVYEGSPYGDVFGNTRFSYITSGNVNNDNATSNDLMYIPRDQNDIKLVPITASRTTTPEDINSQYARLDDYINQDKYLSKHRGEMSQRNGAEYPWANRFDIRILQQIKTVFGEKDNSRFEISVDIINFGNMLNKKWGTTKTPQLTNFLQYKGVVNNTPTYTVSQALPGETFRDNTSIGSRYQVQVGVRYSFN